MPKRKGLTGSTGDSYNYVYLRPQTHLFGNESYDLTATSSSVTEYFPVSSLSDRQVPIQFDVGGLDNAYIDVAETQLYIKGKFQTTAGREVEDIAYKDTTNADKTETPVIVPTNNFGHSIFKRVSVYLQDVKITTSDDNYAYRAYFDMLLNYDKLHQDTQARCAMFYNDATGSQSTSTASDGPAKRAEAANKKEFELLITPKVDIVQQQKWLPPNLNIRFIFERSPEYFYHTCSTIRATYMFNITSAILRIKHRTVLPSVAINHLKTWQTRPMMFPLKRAEVKTFVITPGVTERREEAIFNGLQPYRMVIGLLPSVRFAGAYNTNPLKFEPQDLEYINVTLNGVDVPAGPFQLDFDSGQYLRAYQQLVQGWQPGADETNINITYEQFKTHCTLYCFSLNQSSEATAPVFGKSCIHLKWKTATTLALTCVCFVEYPSCLYISSDKNIWFKDYAIGPP